MVDRRLAYGRDVWVAMEALAQRHSLNDRIVPALYAAATGQLRRESYQEEEGLSRDQALRDIRRLERAGLVESVGYGTALSYVADGEAKRLAAEVAASLTAPAVEPYER